MNIQAEVKKSEAEMKKAFEFVMHDFETINTGKASPSMVEGVMVEVYGSKMRLKDIAAITTPDSNLIRVQPWDKGVLKDIEKAIMVANIGITPSVMGEAVRCPIPSLSGERRAELAKVCRDMAEQGRVRIRNIRRDAMDAFKKAQKNSEITEDELKRVEKDIQNLTDKNIDNINKALEAKEADLKNV
ncbi:MAG: ribosome recycling factor [Opitutales bacterium]|nr:ribosome recycling factor [Opitutales bacterium]